MSEPVVLLVPVKRWDRAKSRLASSAMTPTEDSRVLAEAFARDAIAAAVAAATVSSVHVVTSQPDFAPPGAFVLPDEGDGDLNRAIEGAEARLRAAFPGATIASMCADLPCLRAGELDQALADAISREGRSFVADASGTGTTLLVAGAGHALEPLFGIDSARRHLDSGARAIEGAIPSVRLDVDTADDLDAAVRLGIGAHTTRALAR